jgi:hypothetical protein
VFVVTVATMAAASTIAVAAGTYAGVSQVQGDEPRRRHAPQATRAW